MAGRCIVVDCFRRLLRLDLEFATHTAKRIVLARGVFVERVGGGRVTANSVFGVTMALLKETCHDHT